MACDATMAAKMAIIWLGQNAPLGTQLKKGFEYALGVTLMNAACPMYASSRHGYANTSQLNRIEFRLKAPRSANSASQPVNASRIPPKLFQPSVPLRTRYAPAKYGLNALSTEWSYSARL